MPSHRATHSAISRIVELASFDPEKFEVIVRDNSENSYKKNILSHVFADVLKIHFVPKCDATENAVEGVKLAKGDFIFFLADDDRPSIHGLEKLHNLAQSHADDETIASISGTYFVESRSTNFLFTYPPLNHEDPNLRITSFVNDANSLNFIYYSAIRKKHWQMSIDLINSFPYKLSYADLLITMLNLARGKSLKTESIIYHYDYSQWETLENSHERDASSYVAAGLPIEFSHLHYLLCGLEGSLLLNSEFLFNQIAYDTSQAAQKWFQNMFGRFLHQERLISCANTAAYKKVMALKTNLRARSDFNTKDLLLDIAETINVVDPDGARRYFEFWSTI